MFGGDPLLNQTVRSQFHAGSESPSPSVKSSRGEGSAQPERLASGSSSITISEERA